MLLLVIAIPISVNELPGKTVRGKGIIFYATNKASEWFLSSVVRMFLLCGRKICLVATDIKISVT